MIRWAYLPFALTLVTVFCCAVVAAPAFAQDDSQEPVAQEYQVTLGDTWTALAWRFGSTPEALLHDAGAVNPLRQPAIGSKLVLPAATEQHGRFLRPLAGGLLQIAARNNQNPWRIALQNGRAHPYLPVLHAPLLLPEEGRIPRELPLGFESLAISTGPQQPGRAFALRGQMNSETIPAIILDTWPLLTTRQQNRLVALGATGAFLAPGQYVLTIQTPDLPLWEQPLTFSAGEWTWEQITFNNPAVLDPQEIQAERERLQAIWDDVTPYAMWRGPFQMPIADFVEISSLYGARRSVNGGPYSSYHEGTDFSAYEGTSVVAPASAVVVLAEPLAIRGGSVILDHGLGLHSGYYHLSEIHVQPGQIVTAGQPIGEVGSSGRSTGNHLHWDLLIGRTWVDPLAWLHQDIDTWLFPSFLPPDDRPPQVQ